MKQYQVTLLCVDKKYKPVSSIVTTEEVDNQVITKKGIEKICIQRGWNGKDLKKYGYIKVKVREYDKAKIEAENKARYEKIKEEKYASGEWKRPKEREEK